jgi:hypothetical protein
VDYTYLTDDQRDEIRRRRILQAEADHYNRELDAELAAAQGKPAQAQAAAEAAAELETQIETLKDVKPPKDPKPPKP